MSASVHILPGGRKSLQEPLTLQQMLAGVREIEHTANWLLTHQICVLGFRCSRLGLLITVAPHPRIYILAKGTAERCEFRQIGALRYERWEFARSTVRVTWEEVVCVH